MVYCIGETVLDIIFNGDQVIAAKPGGSMLNTAVSLGRAGIPVEFISEIAADQPGDLIVRFLQQNQVGTRYLNRYADGKTTIALAFLNENADAGYSFYSELPQERLKGPLPVPAPGDIVLFGSFYSLSDRIHEKIKAILSIAAEQNALVCYDPNFRTPHIHDLPKVLPRIMENIAFADIIRGSDEDFLHIFAMKDADDVYKTLRLTDSQVLIFTRSDEAVSIITGNGKVVVPVPGLKPVSTIGAGDSFNAGTIYALINMNINKQAIPASSSDDWRTIAMTAIRFSQNVCMSLDNYISTDFIIAPDK